MENLTKLSEKFYLQVNQDDANGLFDDDGQIATIVYKGGSRYTLGDKPNRHDTYCDNHEDAMYAYFKGEYGFSPSDVEKNVIWLPVYAYVHSGATISTDSSIATCPWDSGRSGFVYTTKEKIRNVRGVKRVSPQIVKQETEFLRGHVKTFDHLLKGDVYWYEVQDADGNMVDSCGGFIGDLEENGMAEHISEATGIDVKVIEEKLSDVEVVY